jgi:hypothetical protein
MTRTMRQEAVPDTKSWHCEPPPHTVRARWNLPSPRVAFGTDCTSLFSKFSTWLHIASRDVRAGTSDYQTKFGQFRGR